MLFTLAVLSLVITTFADWVPEFNGKLDGNTCPLFSGGFQRSSPTFFDVDDDGDADLIWGNEDGLLIFWENVGSAAGADWRMRSDFWGEIDVYNEASPTLGDLNNDGNYDLLVGNDGARISYYINIGGTAIAPTFNLIDSDYIEDFNCTYDAEPGLADIDDDGDLDLFIIGSNGKVWYYRK